MRLRFLDRSRLRTATRRWRGRDRRFAAVVSALEALWSQGLALRMSLPLDGDPDALERPHAALRQWRAFVGVFLLENVRPERVPRGIGADAVPAQDEQLERRLAECGAEAIYDACLADLARAAHDIEEADVRSAPLPLDAAAEACEAPVERVLTIKVRGIPRVT